MTLGTWSPGHSCLSVFDYRKKGAQGAAEAPRRALSGRARVLSARQRQAASPAEGMEERRWQAQRMQGEEMEFRMFFSEGGKTISPWHDIPLKSASGKYNFVCEIPKESAAKMECAIVRPRCLRSDFRFLSVFLF